MRQRVYRALYRALHRALLLTAVVLASQSMLHSATEGGVRRVLLDRVVAVVGNSSILLSELDAATMMLEERQKSEGYTSGRDTRTMALEQLMTQKLMAMQAQIDSVEISLTDIASRVEDQVSAMRDEAGGVRELEESQNMEIFNIRSTLRSRMEEQAYAQAMRGSVVGKITIVPGEVEQYYKSHDRDSLPLIGEQYRYAQITRFPSSIDDAKRRVRERLMGMRERIIGGEAKFTSLASMYSVDPGSAYRGGEMEPQPATAFVGAFADALAQLKAGQISEVVETEFGYHIIELIDKKGDLYHCRHILLRPDYTVDELMEPINFLDSLAGQIRRDSVTFEAAAKLYSDDKSSKMNGGIVTNHDLLQRYNAYDAKLTVTKFLKEDFGARGYKSIDDYLALSKLSEGGVSEAFTTEDMMGNQMAKLVKLVEVYPAHTASMEEDYIRLEEMALAVKQDRIFREWLNRHIDAMYVFIAPEFRSLKFENSRWVK
ncbi:MAG: peptidylprolyl isomerase [Rikenellaceae bacterium]